MTYRHRSYWTPRPNRSANTIPAQPVRYGNTQFKSMAEARWAVLFDALQLPWIYEPRVFPTGRGGYAPDFQLPSLGVWWEVKGAAPNTAAQDAAVSVVYTDGHPVCLAWGYMAPGATGQVWAVLGRGSAVHVGLAQCACGNTSLRPIDRDQASSDPEHEWSFESPELLAAFTRARAVRAE